jgi:N-methylhydantoinase B
VISQPSTDRSIDETLQHMRPQLLRALSSLPLIDRTQIACALADRAGRIAAVDNVARLGTLQSTADVITAYFAENLDTGDVVMTNDPYSGGTRIQDVTVVTPLEVSGRRVGYALVVCPLADLGGMALGGSYPFALEIWAEGVRVTPVLLYRKGALQRDALTMLTLNSRLPHLVDHDVRAMASVVEEVAQGLSSAPATADLEATLGRCVDDCETAFRRRLEALPEGRWFGKSDAIHQCLDESELEVRVEVARVGGSIALDFAGSSAATRGFVNATSATTRSAAVAALAGLLPQNAPNTGMPRNAANAGMFPCVGLDIPEGSFLDARLPLSVGWSVYGAARGVGQAVTAALGCAGAALPPPDPLPEFPFRTPGCGRAGCPFDGETPP